MPSRVATSPVIETRSLAFIRWRARAPRVLLAVLVVALSALGLRTLVRPQPQPVVARLQAKASGDFESEAFAEEFARAYLTWDAGHPNERNRAVSRYASQDLDPGPGLHPPLRGQQHVQWVRAVRDERRGAERLLTV